MLFGIDFDGTFSADPEFFHKLLDLIEQPPCFHKAVIVTSRRNPFISDYKWPGPSIEETTKYRVPVVYAGSDFKREAARKTGYEVDIWIDDNPFGIDEKPLKK